MQYALFACILASIVCGIIGVIIVEKKLVMMSGGIAHTSYGGVGLGYLLGFTPIIGAFIFSVCAALGIGYIKEKAAHVPMWSLPCSGLSAWLWAYCSFALMRAIRRTWDRICLAAILSVTKLDLTLMISLTVIVTLVISVFLSNWKAYLFDDEFAAIIGLKTAIMEYMLLVLTAMTVVVLIKVVGIILVLALLAAPAAASPY